MESKSNGITQIKEWLFLKACTIILVSQRRWAAWMGQRFNSLSKVYRWIFIGIFFVAVALASALSIIWSFAPGNTKRKLHEATMIVAPRFEDTEPSRALDTTMIKAKVQFFERYLDSLERTQTGKIEKVRFLKAHPGLIDSVKRVKNLFNIR